MPILFPRIRWSGCRSNGRNSSNIRARNNSNVFYREEVMEIPNGLWTQDHEQDAVLVSAVYQTIEEEGYEIEDSVELAFDILRRLHQLGYYIKRCGDDYTFDEQVK